MSNNKSHHNSRRVFGLLGFILLGMRVQFDLDWNDGLGVLGLPGYYGFFGLAWIAAIVSVLLTFTLHTDDLYDVRILGYLERIFDRVDEFFGRIAEIASVPVDFVKDYTLMALDRFNI